MRQSSSSISSFRALLRQDVRHGRAYLRLQLFSVVVWTLVALVLIDFVAGVFVRAPADPLSRPTALQSYFNYGLSIEGKLLNLLGKTPDQDGLILRAGWLPQECDVPTKTPAGKLGFDVYGMSFSNQIADFMEQLDSDLVSHRFAGPGAPPNHSYACFLRRIEGGQSKAPIQVLGILASSLPRMLTMSGLTTSFEGPQPFTYPRYSLAADRGLVAHLPSINSHEELHAALVDPVRWRTFTDDLAAHDVFYIPRIMLADPIDHSVMGRLIRRAWGQRIIRERQSAVRGSGDFSGVPDLVPVLKAIILDFANRTRTSGGRPIVILIEDQGYGRSLSAITENFLISNGIEHVATSNIVSPEDSSNFVSDGHFTPSANKKIAEAVVSIVRN